MWKHKPKPFDKKPLTPVIPKVKAAPDAETPVLKDPKPDLFNPLMKSHWRKPS